MKRVATLLIAQACCAHAWASRYSDALPDDSEEFVGRFSDAAQLAVVVFLGLTAFVFFTWDEKRTWLRWGSRACLALAVMLLFTKPALLAVFVFGPIALFFLWPMVTWVRKKIQG